MESLAWLAVLVPLLGVAMVVVFIVAIVQEGKAERRGGFKQAFFTMVTLVMLGISVGATIGLLNTTMRNVIFRGEGNTNRFNAPPYLYLPSAPSVATPEGVKSSVAPTIAPYTCASECQFSADDKAAVKSWKAEYKRWQTNSTVSYAYRRDLAVILPFLIVALPLFFVFFRLMQKGAVIELTETKKLSPIRSLYFYFIAFSGLLVAVIGAGGLVNLGLNQALRVNEADIQTVPALSLDTVTVKNIITCATACDFTTDDVAMAERWVTDAEKFSTEQTLSKGKIGSDLSNFLPLLLIGFPLFWFHFNRIRKETQDHQSTPATS